MHVMSQHPDPWLVDPDDPRAPPQEIWDRLTETQRQRVLDSLPSEFEATEARPPEGDLHTEEVYGARTALRRFFGKTGRSIYIGTNLPVYYPGQAMFSPDVMAVLDVPIHPRSSWVVSREGKGLNFALEVIVLGNRRKDVKLNVERYATLGIGEYFIFDRPKLRLQGFRLRHTGGEYEQLIPQHGRLPSKVLWLDLGVERGRLRFFVGDAELPGADELILKLEGFVNDLETRVANAERRAEEEAHRADEMRSRLEEALAELERLKKRL
jgi:Uma2 family endonuclease